MSVAGISDKAVDRRVGLNSVMELGSRGRRASGTKLEHNPGME